MQEMYQWEEELLQYMVENDIDYVEGRDIYLDEASFRGVQKLLRGLGDKAMPAVRAGYRRVKRGGKWVLEKIKKPGKGADAVDSATPPVKKRGMPGTDTSAKTKTKTQTQTQTQTPDPKKKNRNRPNAPKPDAPEPPKPQSRGRIRKAVTGAAALGVTGLALKKGHDYLKNRSSDTSTKPETSSPGSSSPGSSSPGGSTTKPGGSTTKPGGSGSKPTPSPQTTQNPQQRAKNRSSWNKPVGRREHIAANNRSIRREETSIIRDLTAELFEGLPEPKVHWLKDMDVYDPRRSPRDHAPGAPLPPASYRPGLPDMRLPRASKKGKKDKKNA